jgi:VIT1/CCC1 family predicted Fe2+/Mn2+ transporter
LEDFERMEIRPKIKATSKEELEAKRVLGFETPLIGLGIRSPSTKDKVTSLIKKFVDILTSFLFAFRGGIALIAPMLIMVLHPSRNTSLIVTCVFVIAFALGLALYSTVITYIGARYGTLKDIVGESDLKAKETLGATAAYAAVLVVFVGTSTTIS